MTKIINRLKLIFRPTYHRFKRSIKFIRRIGLKNKTVTIISNNCCGGYIYQYFGLKYYTPTIGLFFYTEDYIRFCKRVEYYINCKIEFINHNESKNKDKLNQTNKWGEYPIARLDDIEIYFMHYKNEEEVLDKWYKRIKRVDLNNMYFLLTENESSSAELVEDFLSLEHYNKICLTATEYNTKGCVFIEEVSKMKEYIWSPKIIIKSINWKKEFNELKIGD